MLFQTKCRILLFYNLINTDQEIKINKYLKFALTTFYNSRYNIKNIKYITNTSCIMPSYYLK